MTRDAPKESRALRSALHSRALEYQTKLRGSNAQEYEIYRINAASLGWPVKSFDEWMNS